MNPIDPDRGKWGYAKYFASQIKELTKALQRAGVSPKVRADISASGYMLWEDEGPAYKTGPLTPIVHDGFYGTKWGYGFIPLPDFITLAQAVERLPINPGKAPEYHVSSIAEIISILQTDRHGRFVEEDRMCFRGQTREYTIERPFPNPNARHMTKCERVIIPNFWRKFIGDYNRRPFRNDPEPLLSSIVAGSVIFQEFEDWRTFEERRRVEFPFLDIWIELIKRQNPFALHEFLENNPEYQAPYHLPDRIADLEFAAYMRCWLDHILMATAKEEPIVLEQHYGMPTCGLDVTYALEIAGFFATNKFVQKDARSNVGDFAPVLDGTHQGVIYCFVFEDPPAYRSEELINSIKTFSHCPPKRPLQQQCALPYFHAENFNEAVVDMDAVFYLNADFSSAGVPHKEELFPTPQDDPFYRALLSAKREAPSHFRDVVEYQFDE